MSDPAVFWTVVGHGLTAVGLGFTAWTLWQGNVWKRKEAAALVYEKLRADTKAGNAMTMLDWNIRRVLLHPEAVDDTKRFVRVDDRMLGTALIPHNVPDRPSWTNDYAAIRDSFDAFLDHLENIGSMIEANLIKIEDVKPYLTYWIKLIGDPKTRAGDDGYREKAIRNLWIYIKSYDYPHTIHLAWQLGYDIDVDLDRGEEIAELILECHKKNVWHIAGDKP